MYIFVDENYNTYYNPVRFLEGAVGAFVAYNFLFCFLPPILSEENSALKEFLEKTSKMNPEERAAFLEKDDVRKTLKRKIFIEGCDDEVVSDNVIRKGFAALPPELYLSPRTSAGSCRRSANCRFCFQSIRVTHETSAQEGQTEVCTEFYTCDV